MISIYYAPPSIYGRKVLAVLEEKGLDYEIRKMSFASQDHLKDDYLALNPNGEIPTLVDDQFTVYESTPIIEYLNDEYPVPALLPEDSEGRAKARIVEDFCDLHFYRDIVRILMKKLQNQEATADDTSKLEKDLARLEAYLGKKNFFSDSFSLADCAVMAGIFSLEYLGYGSLVKSKSLKDYMARVKSRPAYKGATLFSFDA